MPLIHGPSQTVKVGTAPTEGEQMPLMTNQQAGGVAVFGVDYSWGRPHLDALLAADAVFVCRYLSRDGSGKNLTGSEAKALSAAGLSIVVVWEDGKSRALAGKDAGARDAQEAANQAEACGMPGGRPIYFAVDFDATAAQLPAVMAYLDGAASVLGRGRVGVYGGHRTVKAALDAGKATWAWQTYAWSGTPTVWDGRAQLRQYKNDQSIGGAGVDFDESNATDFGQWKVREPMKLVTRKAWGARAPKAAVQGLTSTRGVKVHYTGDPENPAMGGDHGLCAGRVRSIQNAHMDGNGWNDIGYSALVCPHGYVYVGRGPHHLPAANGPGLNSDHYAACGLVGKSGLTKPSDAMLGGIRDAIEWLRAEGDAGTEIKGHRDGYATDCPGDLLYAWVKKGAPRPAPAPEPTPQEDDMPYGQLLPGKGQQANVSCPRGSLKAAGLVVDNSLAIDGVLVAEPPAKVRYAIHRADGHWQTGTVDVGSKDGGKDGSPKTVISFDHPDQVDWFSLTRLDDGTRTVGWDAS